MTMVVIQNMCQIALKSKKIPEVLPQVGWNTLCVAESVDQGLYFGFHHLLLLLLVST